MLKPYDARQMRCYPVSTRINHLGNDDEKCCATRGTRTDSESALFVVGALGGMNPHFYRLRKRDRRVWVWAAAQRGDGKSCERDFKPSPERHQ
jgi:hypothetical protein